MASRKTTYTIGFDVDANKAQQQLNNLTKTLQNLTKQNQINLGLDEDIRKATESAKVLQSTLSKALDINTGKIDFSAFTSELKKANTSVSEIANNLLNAGSAGQAAFAQMSASLASSEVQINKVNNAVTQFAQTLKNTVKWEISSNIVHGIESALNNAISYAKELNGTLNDIRIVSGASVDDMAQFAVQANKAAQSLSTTTNEFAKASLIYYQQGDSAALAAEKAAITTKAANVAFSASAKEMSQLLTAVWNSYQMGEDQLEHAVDVMAKLGATTASSTEEIAKAMQKVAPTANAVGVSFEQMSTIIATAASVTRQSAETVGTSWNTIINRLGSLKLGKTLEDGVTLTKYSNALKTVGVNVLDASGNLRDMGIIIDELGAKWNTLTQTQKAALAQTVGGARNYTQITAFFENFDKYQKNMINANNAKGELNKQAEIYAQSWEAATKRQKAALESLYDSIINDKAMITMTDGLTTIIGLVEGLVSGLGGIPGVLANIGLIANRVFKDQITKGLADAGRSIANLGQQIQSNGFFKTIGLGLQGKLASGAELRQAQAAQEAANAAQTQSVLASQRGDSINARTLQLQSDMLNQKAGYARNGRQMTSNQQAAFNQRMDAASEQVMAIAASQNSYNAVQQQGSRFGSSSTLNAVRQNNALQTVLKSQGLTNGRSVIGAYGLDTTEGTGLMTADGEVDVQHLQAMRMQAQKMSAIISGISQDVQQATAGVALGEDDISTEEIITNLTQNLNDLAAMDADEVNAQIHRLDKSEDPEIAKIQAEVETWYKELLQRMNNAAKDGRAAAQEAVENGELTAEDVQAANVQGEAEGNARLDLESNIADLEANLNDESLPEPDKFEKIAGGIQKVGTMAMSAVAGISSMSGMMDTLGDSSATTQQKIGAVMGAASTLANAFATGGPWAAVAAGAAMAAVAVIKSIDAQQAKMAEYRRKQGEMAIEAVEKAKEEKSTMDEQYESFKDLQKAYEEGEISHAEYVEGLTSVAEAMDVEGAKVLALTGNYSGLADAIERANKKRLEQEAASARGLVQQTQAQAGNIFESTLEASMGGSTVKRRGSQLIIDNLLSDVYDELEQNIDWEQISSRNATGEAARFRERYGIEEGDQGWEAVAKILGGTQGGDTGNWFGASMFDRNANNITLGTSPEQILAMYEHILELQEKAQDTESVEGRAIAALLQTSKVDQLVQAVTAAAEPIKDAKAMERSSSGALALEEKYGGKVTSSDYSRQKRDNMVQELIASWDIDANNEAEVEAAKKLAQQLVDNFWLGVDEGLETTLAQENERDASIKKIQEYVKARYGQELDASVFEDIDTAQLLAVNPYDLNFVGEDGQFSTAAVAASARETGAQNAAVQRYNRATSVLDSYYSGDYDADELGRQMIEELYGDDEELRKAALAEFADASVDDKIALLDRYATQLNNGMDEYLTAANQSIVTANKNVQGKVKQLEQESQEFVEKLGLTDSEDKPLNWEGLMKLYETYQRVRDASVQGATMPTDLDTGTIIDLMNQTGTSNETMLTGLNATDLVSSYFAQSGTDMLTVSREDYIAALEELGLAGAVDLSENYSGGGYILGDIDYSKIDIDTFLSWIMAHDPDAGQKIMANIANGATDHIFTDENIAQIQTYTETYNGITGQQEVIDPEEVAKQRKANLAARLESQLETKTSDYGDLDAMRTAGFIKGDAEALAWIDMTDIQRKEQALKAMKQTLEDLKATGQLTDVEEALYNSKIRLQEIEILQSKIQDTATLQGLTHDAAEQEELFRQGQMYYDQMIALYDKDSIEYKQAVAQKEAAATEYYSNLAAKADAAAAVIQDQWDKETAAQDTVLSTISSNLGQMNKLNFQSVDDLRQNLIDAGIAATRVDEILNNISNAKTDKEEIKAEMVAATEAALAKLKTLGAEKKEFAGVVTSLDTSPIDDKVIELPAEADTTKAEETLEGVIEQEYTVTVATEIDDDNITAASTTWDADFANKTLTITNVNGETVTTAIETWDANLTNKTLTITTVDGQIFTAQIESWQTDLANSTVTFTTVDGQVVTDQIATWDSNLSNNTFSITTVSGAEVTSAITQWHSDINNQTFTVTLDTGEQITSTITGWRAYLNDSGQNVLKFSIQNGDGTTGTVEQIIKSWIPDGEKVLITVDDGEEETTITAKIDSWVYGQDPNGKRYITVAMDDGSTLTADVTEAVDNGDGTVTVKMADGSKTQLPADIKTSIGSGYDVPLKAGNSLQPEIDNMELTATVTLQMDAAQEALNQMFKQIDLDFTYFFTDTDYHAAAELLSKPFEEMMETLSEEESWKTGLFGWGKGGEGIKWDGTQGYVMRSLVEHLTKMPQSEFTKMGKDQLQLIIGALGKAMESSDADTRELATQLWAGLSVGMKDNYDAETWVQILESCGLSEDMLQAFKDALGIESPSKLTKGLAHFLFEGLVEGMKDGDAAFEGVDLPNVKEKIKESVENAIDEIGIEKIISDSYQQQLEEALNTENADEKASKLISLGLSQQMSQEIAEAGGVQQAAQKRGEDAYNTTFDQYITDHTSEAYSYYGSYSELEAAARIAAEEAQKAAIEEFDAAFAAEGEQSASDYLGRYLKHKEWNLVDSKTLTDVQKHILNAALDKTLSDLHVDSIDEAIAKYGEEKVMEVFEQNINTSSEEVTKAVEKTWNEIQGIWQSGLEQIFANEEAKAAETYELWKNTFKAIADARAGLMEGKTIMQSLYQNPDELANVITMLLNQGYEMSEIYKMLNDPDAVLNFQAFDAEAYRMSGKQKYLNLDENGNYANTSEAEFRAHVTEDVSRLTGTELASIFKESLGGEEGLKVLAKGDASERALLQELIDKKLIRGEYDSETGEFSNLGFLTDQEFLSAGKIEELQQAVIDGIMQGMDQSGINALLGEASATQTAGYYSTMMTAQSEGEKQLGIWQNNADLINNAFSTLLEKGNLDSMSLDDQNELVKILQDMGILGENADASSLSLETLQTAAEQTASAMQTLAEEITKAMQMLANGEADSWQIGDDGHVTVSQSYAQAEANGFENVAMDEDKLAELQAAMEAEAAKRAQEKIRQEGYTMDQVTNDSSAVGETARSIYAEAKAKALEEVKKETQVDIKLGEDSVSDDVAGDTITSGKQAVNQQQVQTMEAYAKACGLANDEYKKLLTQVSAVSNKTQEFNTLSKAEQQQLMSVVTATKKAETAWDNLATKQKDAIEIIKTGNKTDLEYLENLNAVTSNVKDIFGGASAITNEFVESHIADIEKMAAGDEDAAERVEEAWLTAQAELDGWDPHKTVDIDVNQDGVIDELDNLGTLFDSYFDQWTNEPIGFSLEADDSQVIETLQNLIDSGDMTAEGINEALAGIGWEPEIEYVPMTSEMKAQQQIGATVYDFYGNPFTVTEEALADNDLTFYMPHIKSVKKQSTGAHSMPQSTRRRVTERPRTGRRTGDRSRREDDRREEDERDYGDPASREWEKKTKDEIERYHQVNKQLDYQSTFLERINKLKGFKYGVDYVNALRQENAELVRQAELQKKKYEEAQKWLAYDQSRLGSLSQQTISWWAQDEQERREVTLGSLGLANITPTYDEDGNLNYQDLREQMIRQYNEMGEKYSEDPEQWADAWAAYQEWYEDVMSQIDDYEESLDNVRQHINEVLATIEQVASNNAQIIKYKVQLEITEIDFGKSWQDYLMKKFNNDISKIADGMKATMAKIFGSGFDEAGKAMGGSLKALDVYLKQLDEAQEKYKTYLKYQDDIDSFMQNGDSEAYQKLQELLGFGSDGSDAADSFLTGAQFFEMAKEIREKILAELNNLEDYKQALSQSYTNLLSLTKSEWDKYNQIASHRYNLINTFKEIAELSGQNYGEEWEKWEAAMTAAQSQHLSDMMEQSQTLFETHAAQVAHFEQMLAQGQTLSNLEREQYEASLQAMQEAENQMYDYTKQKLALLKTEYEKTIDDIIKKFQKNILEGTDNTTFEELASDYEWWNKEQEMYLSTTKELYEVSKLNRTINDSIAESSSAATKARLAALKEEINKYAELNKLTEYDVQQLNLQYKLAMALDELENAQNNKSTVRLTRDEYGNMGYQYTTDEDKVSSAQQQYEDVLQEINDLATNRVKELEGAYIQTMQDYIAEARQIALEYADDEETREKKLEELAEKYSSRLNIINEQLGIATQHLLQNNDTIFEHYNENVERYIGTPNGEEGINPTIQQLSSAWENHESMVVDMTSAIIAAMQEYYQEAAATTEQVSATLQGMQDRFAGLQQATDYAEGSLSNLTDTLKDQYTELNNATEGWKAYAASVATAQEEAEKALQTISDLMAGVMGSDEAQAVLGALTGSGSGSGGTGSTGGSSGGDYGGGGDNKVDTVKYKFKKDAKVTKNWDGKTEVSGVSPLGEDKVYTVSKLKGNAVYIAELGGWIHVLDIMKETSKSSTYSTTALALSDAIAQKRIDLDDDDYTYATGGLADFTGPAWLDGTPSRPEYVLNAQQTDRMFDAIEATSKLDVGLISDIFDTINMLTSSLFAGMGNSISPNNIASTQNSDSHNIEQHVEIHAEFPDASDYTEIKEAFDNIINAATQYANR